MTPATLPDDRRAPAFSFYAQDFIVGTLTMTLVERGAYITFLAHQWDRGGVPDDSSARARILGCPVRQADAAWAGISEKFFKGTDGLWRNARLETERLKQAERRAALALNGRKGGRPKGKPNKNQKDKQIETKRLSKQKANGNQNESLTSSSSSSSSSSSVTPISVVRRA